MSNEISSQKIRASVMTLSIVPNLMVSDLAASVEFYRHVLAMDIKFIVDADQNATEDPAAGAFAMLFRDDAHLMLQTEASLAEELPIFANVAGRCPSGTTYFRGIHPDEILPRIDKARIEKGPFRQWYGMTELYFRDPDSHIICAAAPDTSSGDNG